MEWVGGRYAGNYRQVNRGNYLARIMKDRKSYCKTFDTSEKAIQWLIEKSEEFGMIKNKYRLIDNEYYEVQLNNDKIFFCDKEDIDIVKQYIWHEKKSKNTSYVYGTESKDKKIIFHRIIKPWGTDNEWKQVDHIDRNGLNNRKLNLRNGDNSINNLNQAQREDNISGKTGVHYSNYDNCWIVQWKENGKRKKKSFRVCNNLNNRRKGNYHTLTRTYEEAKQLAIEFRIKKDKELGYTNGYKMSP